MSSSTDAGKEKKLLFDKRGFCFIVKDSSPVTNQVKSLLLEQGFSILIELALDLHIQKTLDGEFCASHFGHQPVSITIHAVGFVGTLSKGCLTVGGSLDSIYKDYMAHSSLLKNKYILLYDGVTYRCCIVNMSKLNAKIPDLVLYTFRLIGERQ